MKPCVIYDIETYPNCFTLAARDHQSGEVFCFEISDRRNDHAALCLWLSRLQSVMVGFNSLAFDYPILHRILLGLRDPEAIFNVAQQLITSDSPYTGVKPWEIRIPQLDLMRVKHYNNKARRVGLKELEFNMRFRDIQDLPYSVGKHLEPDEMENLRRYNIHDVLATEQFMVQCKGAIEFRETLGDDHRNLSDTKIGERFFVKKLEESGVSCYCDRLPRQTPRTTIRVVDILLPVIRFKSLEFQRVLAHFRGLTVDGFNVKSTPEYKQDYEGVTYHFGVGGIHASMNDATLMSTESAIILDFDVTSYYPSVPIAHGFYPAHLGPRFCEVYRALKAERLKHPKGSTQNAALKIALNSVYGLSNSQYSPFYDPQYTVQTTINGQLLLAMLAEQLTTIPGLRVIQANTDGVTVLCPTASKSTVLAICKAWENTTGLDLESAEYSRMWVRDVNNYIAEHTSGKIKRIGAYRLVSEMQKMGDWHKDMSFPIVRIAASEYLLNGVPIEHTIRNHQDLFDFCGREKVARTHRLMWGNRQTQRISRFYVTPEPHGSPLTKVMPPLATEEEREECEMARNQVVPFAEYVDRLKERIKNNRKKGSPEHNRLAELRMERDRAIKQLKQLQSKARRLVERPQARIKGYNVQVCNRIDDATVPVNYEFYEAEVRKLVGVFG